MAIIAIAFIALTILVVLDPLPMIDKEFSAEVQEHANPFINSLAHALSWAGYMPNSVYVVLGVIVIFLLLKYYREALFVLLSSLAGLVSTLVKLFVDRPRPGEPFVHVLEKTQQKSFPSGHVLFYTVFFGFIALAMYRRIGIPKFIRFTIIGICLLFIILIPPARVCLGAHWFTDVLGGGLLGLICLYVLAYFYMKESVK